jgi:hypothetical protein
VNNDEERISDRDFSAKMLDERTNQSNQRFEGIASSTADALTAANLRLNAIVDRLDRIEAIINRMGGGSETSKWIVGLLVVVAIALVGIAVQFLRR